MATSSRARRLPLPAAPKPRMTGGKATLLFSIAIIFDALKFMCNTLWLFGPLLAGAIAGAATGSSFIGEAVGVIAGIATLPVAAWVEAAGLIMADAVSFIGLLLLITIMTTSGIQLFKSKSGSFITLFLGGIASFVPFVNAAPSFTISTWRIVSGQRKADRDAQKQYERENAAALRQQQQIELGRQRQMLQWQAAQQAQEEEQAEAEQAEEEAEDVEQEEPLLAPPYERTPREPLAGVPSL